MSWLFDPATRVRRGGSAAAYAFRPSIDVFVREVIQNAKDQRRNNVPLARVHFRLTRLHGTSLTSFLEALEWVEVRKHLLAAAETGTHAHFLKQSVKALEEQGELLLLRVDDFGTKGLTGGDLDRDKPFASLCVDELFSAKDSAGAGGSYGLGKSVLWRFSAFSTVFFSSYLDKEAEGQSGLRVFGRTQLPWHSLGELSFDGPSWFGRRSTAQGEDVALSYWDPESQTLGRRLHLGRPKEPGTSILIVGFRPPAEEVIHPKHLCEMFCTSASVHFWPVLFGDAPQLQVTAELINGETGECEESFESHITDEIKPFVECVERFRNGETTEELQEPRDVAKVEIPVKIPAEQEGQASVDARVSLCVQVVPKTKGRTNQVAYSRGFGMVVRYRNLEGVSLSAKPFVATLLCGTLRGNAPEDVLIERFLRLAEPPEHDTWAPNQRLQSTYKKGYGALLDKLNRDVENNIKRLVSTATVAGEAGPELLARMFPIGTHGKTKRSHPFQVLRPTANLSGDLWLFGGEVRRVKGEGPWQVRVALRFGTEDGAEGSVVGEIHHTDPQSKVVISAGVALIYMKAESTRLKFKGRSDKTMHPVDARRAAVRLDVMPGTPEDSALLGDGGGDNA